MTREGRGTVTEVNLLSGMLKVRLEDGAGDTVVSVHKSEVKSLRDNRNKQNAAARD